MRILPAQRPAEGRLHSQVTRALALQVIRSSRHNQVFFFPREADLCAQLGVSRSILRESMKVLTDKGMVEMKPRAGTRSRRIELWNRMDPDILCWQAELGADAGFLQQLCEVRLAIEPTAAGFAAVRASEAEIDRLRAILADRLRAQSAPRLRRPIDLDLDFQATVVHASRNPLLIHLAEIIREPFRLAWSTLVPSAAEVRLSLEAHEALVEALARRDALAARRAAEDLVGFAMLCADHAARNAKPRRARPKKGTP